MIATFINVATVIIGSILGLIFKNKIKERYTRSIMFAIGLCVIVIGVMSALKTGGILTVIVCVAVGTGIGELLRIEDRLDGAGELLRKKFSPGDENSRFTEGFVAATILFCVGSMAIVGSLEAGINKNYSILISKSIMDGISSLAFAATMGWGVIFSAAVILVYQGGLTLLASALAPVLSTALVNEMTAVGGVLLIGIAVNMLGLGKEKIRVANMLPAIFLPIAYLPLADWLTSLF